LNVFPDPQQGSDPDGEKTGAVDRVGLFLTVVSREKASSRYSDGRGHH
jgi:hypothetical protein